MKKCKMSLPLDPPKLAKGSMVDDGSGGLVYKSWKDYQPGEVAAEECEEVAAEDEDEKIMMACVGKFSHNRHFLFWKEKKEIKK